MDKTISRVFFYFLNYIIYRKIFIQFTFIWNNFVKIKIEINIKKGDEKDRYKRNSQYITTEC